MMKLSLFFSGPAEPAQFAGRSFTATVGALMTALCMCASAFGAESLIERVDTLDLNTMRCLTCADESDAARVRDLVERSQHVDLVSWLKTGFEPLASYLKESAGKGPDWVSEFTIQAMLSEGYYFHVGDRRYRYWEKECKVFDCYKAYLVLEQPPGERRWQRRVPYLEMPVYPLAVGDYLLFLGGREIHDALVILNARTGRVVEEYCPPDCERGFESIGWEVFAPVYLDGHVCLIERLKVNMDGVVTNEPRVFVLKVRF